MPHEKRTDSQAPGMVRHNSREEAEYTRQVLLHDNTGPDMPGLYHGLVFGRYRIESKLGGGGMGAVFLAREISMRRFVALKVLHRSIKSSPESPEHIRFLEEMHLLAGFEHPGIVRIYDAGELYGIPYFSMEALDGSDLKKILAARGRLSIDESLDIVEQTAQTLCYAWNHAGMVHRDIKPANLILTTEKSVKILDLGISLCFSHLEATAERTQDADQNGIAGSPYYLSPEQALNHTGIDFRADEYSLGITLFHFLTGHPPFQGVHPKDVISMHIFSPLPEIRDEVPEATPELSAFLRRITAKRPDDRFESWEVLLQHLEEVRQLQKSRQNPAENSSLPEKGKKYSLHQPTSLPLSSIPFFWMVLVFLGILIIAGALFCVFRMPRNSASYRIPSENFSTKNIPPSHKNESALLLQEDPLDKTTESSDASTTAPSLTLSAYMKERTAFLNALRQKSYSLETKGLYQDALDCWQNAVIPEKFQEDPTVLREFQISETYLRNRLSSMSSSLKAPSQPDG